MMQTVAVFDFLSHPSMHLPFNEGYVRVLRAAYPDVEILFCADGAHVANLRAQIPPELKVAYRPVERFAVAAGSTPHNPVWGRRAAAACWRDLESALRGRAVEFVALLGAEANLLSVFRRKWARRADAPLHFILHNHLAAAVRWRTRNPLFRPFDYISELRKGLPAGQKLVALELGIAAAVESMFPALRGAVVTLEHPVLELEWAESGAKVHDGPVKVGFLGHCGRGKGFDFFVELAQRFTGPELEFHAIGLANPNAADVDVSVLKRAPSPEPVPRAEYVARVAELDLICLPMPSTYSYVASGSVIDAIAATKPLALIRNPSYAAIADSYGAFGPMFTDRAEMEQYFATFSAVAFRRERSQWVESLRRIREARRPRSLAETYPPERVDRS